MNNFLRENSRTTTRSAELIRSDKITSSQWTGRQSPDVNPIEYVSDIEDETMEKHIFLISYVHTCLLNC